MSTCPVNEEVQIYFLNISNQFHQLPNSYLFCFSFSFADSEFRSWRRQLNRRCRTAYRECQRDLRGRPAGKVCGSDNRTYKNKCRLQRDACERSTSIDVVFHGSCKRKNKVYSRKGAGKGKMEIKKRLNGIYYV